jgi:hypothetical protein
LHRERFVNERGNEITVAAETGHAADEIVLSLLGPRSESTNTITRREALMVCSVLSRLLADS